MGLEPATFRFSDNALFSVYTERYQIGRHSGHSVSYEVRTVLLI
jgi:hypothetical protein